MIVLKISLILRLEFLEIMISKEENILLAAEKIFAEKGFEGASTREIAKLAGVNISMISYYFGSKEKLFENIFRFRMKKSHDFIEKIMGNDDYDEWQKMTTMVESYVDKVRENKNFYRLIQAEQLTSKNLEIANMMGNSKATFLKIFKKLTDDGFAKHIFTKKVNVACLHSTVSGTIFQSVNNISLYKHFMEYGGNEDFETLFSEEIKNHLKDLLKDQLGYEN